MHVMNFKPITHRLSLHVSFEDVKGHETRKRFNQQFWRNPNRTKPRIIAGRTEPNQNQAYWAEQFGHSRNCQ